MQHFKYGYTHTLWQIWPQWPLQTWCLWKRHIACKKFIIYISFSWMQRRPAWIGLWRQLLTTTQVFANYNLLTVQVHSTRLETKSDLKKTKKKRRSHVNVMISQKLCLQYPYSIWVLQNQAIVKHMYYNIMFFSFLMYVTKCNMCNINEIFYL